MGLFGASAKDIENQLNMLRGKLMGYHADQSIYTVRVNNGYEPTCDQIIEAYADCGFELKETKVLSLESSSECARIALVFERKK